jgi:GNAT superfamily N-acetyltransferase
MRILFLADCPPGAEEAEAIFWESAGTRQFESEAARNDYRALWFGRYIKHAPSEFRLAVGVRGDVAGYLAGALISDVPPLPGPDYYALFAPGLLAAYPAHVHVNVRADCRGAGIGGALTSAFADHCRQKRVPGLHAVTAAGSRAAAFFQRCGLRVEANATWHGRDLAFLAKRCD